MSSLPKDSFSTPQNGRKNIAHFLCHIAKIPALPRSETQSFLRKKQKKIPSKQSIHLSDGTCKLDRFLISIITHVMVICSSGDPPLRKLGYCLRWKDVCKKQRKKKSERITRLGKIRCKVIRGWIFFLLFFFLQDVCISQIVIVVITWAKMISYICPSWKARERAYDDLGNGHLWGQSRKK